MVLETAATGRVSGGNNGFQYSNTAGGATFIAGYAIKVMLHKVVVLMVLLELVQTYHLQLNFHQWMV